MSPVLLNPYRFAIPGGGGGSAADYTAAVLADSPWAHWPTDDDPLTIGYNADAAGARHLDRVAGIGTAHSYMQPGPTGENNAIQWSDGESYAETAGDLMATNGVGTVDLFLKIDALPPTRLGVITHCTSNASNWAWFIRVSITGYVDWVTRAAGGGGENVLTSSTALTLGSWHHVAASIGAAGKWLRQDGVSVGTAAQTTTFVNATARMVRMNQPTVSATYRGPHHISMPAVWDSQLTTAQTDAHYAAAGV